MVEEEMKIPTARTQPLVKGDKTFRSAYDYNLTKEDLKQASLQLGETESVRKSSLEALKTKLAGDVNLQPNSDDAFLLRYLRFHKYNVEKAHTMLCNLYRLRADYPELFEIPQNLETLLASNFIKNLPFRDEEGSIIFWVDFRNWNAQEMSVTDLLKVVNAKADLFTMNPSCQVNYTFEFWDLRGLTVSHYLNLLYPRTVILALKLLQECYPWRIKRVVAVHCSTLVRIVFKFFRYLLNKEIADNMVLLGDDMSELHKYINPALLPKEYGGNIEETDCSMKEFLMQNVPYMKYQRQFKFIA